MRIATFQRGLAYVVLSLLPGFALASDPTPLFVIFVGVPAAIVSALLVGLAYAFPRGSLVCSIVFLAAHIPLMYWAFKVGYMSDAGGWLCFSSLAAIFSLFLAISRIKRQKARGLNAQVGGT